MARAHAPRQVEGRHFARQSELRLDDTMLAGLTDFFKRKRPYLVTLARQVPPHDAPPRAARFAWVVRATAAQLVTDELRTADFAEAKARPTLFSTVPSAASA